MKAAMADKKSEAKNEIRNRIDRSRDEVFQTLQKLVQIPSVVGQEGEAQKWMASLYSSLGLDVVTVVPEKESLQKHPAYVETGLPYDQSRPNIIGIFSPSSAGSKRSLILNGHIDVVSPEPVETWDFDDPWSGRIDGNRMYGRGSADMKSGLLSNFFALKSVFDLGMGPKGRIVLESVIEEEAGGSGGTLATLMAGCQADVMIIPEPLGLRVVTAHPGVNYFRVKVYGKTAHAGWSHYGVNAIGKMMKIYDRLIQLDKQRAERNRNEFFEKETGRSCNLNIGTLKAGDWPSTVAGWAQLEARISYLPWEKEDDIKKEVEAVVGEVANGDEWLKERPPDVEWFGWRAQPWVQDPEVPVIRQFRKSASEILSDAPQVTASTAGLDTRFTPFFGFPSFVFGPVGGLLHSSNEYVELDSVIQTIKVLATFIVDWCDVE